MNIYVEPLIMENLVLNCLIGALSYRLLRLKGDNLRVMLAALLGTAVALLYPLMNLPAALLALVKISVGVTLSAVLYSGKCKFVTGLAVYVGCTFLFGGLALAIGCLLSGDTGKLPGVFVTVTASVLVYGLARACTAAFHRKRDTESLVYSYRLKLGEREICGNGFLDTGNRLYDAVTGLPVVVLSVGALLSEMSEEECAELLCGHADRVYSGARKIRARGFCSGTEMWIVKSDEFVVYFDEDKNILYDVMVGLSFSPLGGSDGSYDAILHPALI